MRLKDSCMRSEDMVDGEAPDPLRCPICHTRLSKTRAILARLKVKSIESRLRTEYVLKEADEVREMLRRTTRG